MRAVKLEFGRVRALSLSSHDESVDHCGAVSSGGIVRFSKNIPTERIDEFVRSRKSVFGRW